MDHARTRGGGSVIPMPLTSSLDVRPLALGDVARVARLLATSFDRDPAYAYLFPREATRHRGLEDLFARNLRAHARYGCTYVGVREGAILATVTVRPYGGIEISPLTMLRDGLLPFALAQGPSAVRRLFVLLDVYDGLEARAAAGDPHFHVHMMAVDRNLQGSGVGSALIADALARATDDRGPVVLTTHEERNVVFYRRQGFTVCDERILSLRFASTPYSVWSMRREPGAPT